MKEALDPENKSLNEYKLKFGGQMEMNYSYTKINSKLFKKLSSLYQNIGS
jgi:hypothetical protein